MDENEAENLEEDDTNTAEASIEDNEDNDNNIQVVEVGEIVSFLRLFLLI